MLKQITMAGVYSSIDEVLGLETRVALYPGRPVRIGDIGPPAAIERNQIVVLKYERNGMFISTEGRSLMRGAIGDWIKVMNLASRNTVSGQIQRGGHVLVSY